MDELAKARVHRGALLRGLLLLLLTRRACLCTQTCQHAQRNQDDSRAVERWFYADWLNASWFKTANAKQQQRQQREGDAAGTETTLSPPSADAPQPGVAGEGAGGEQEPYRDVQPNFWSLDNPIVATGALLCGMVALAALQH